VNVVKDGASDAPADGAADGKAQSDGALEAEADGAASDASQDADIDAPLTVRRPFLVRSVPRASDATSRSDWMKKPGDRSANVALNAATTRALAAAWLEDGRQEHASIAAFARFTMLLLGVGAPPDLLAGSQRASLDEIEHAKMCFSLASRFGETDVGPTSLKVDDAMTDTSLIDLAVLTAKEGCVGETLGVALATEQLALATDPEVKAYLEKIVKDEIRHAELAWRFIGWAIAAGGAPVHSAVTRAIDEALVIARSLVIKPLPEGVDLGAWNANGRLTCQAAQEATDRAIREVVEPCVRALASDGARGAREAGVEILYG
jgi:hypothetical protein